MSFSIPIDGNDKKKSSVENRYTIILNVLKKFALNLANKELKKKLNIEKNYKKTKA